MGKYTCSICGREIPWHTAIVVSHLRKHVREGKLSETKKEGGGITFTTPEGKVVSHTPTTRE